MNVNDTTMRGFCSTEIFCYYLVSYKDSLLRLPFSVIFILNKPYSKVANTPDVLRTVMDIPWYFRNKNTRRDLKMSTVSEQIVLKDTKKR